MCARLRELRPHRQPPGRTDAFCLVHWRLPSGGWFARCAEAMMSRPSARRAQRSSNRPPNQRPFSDAKTEQVSTNWHTQKPKQEAAHPSHGVLMTESRTRRSKQTQLCAFGSRRGQQTKQRSSFAIKRRLPPAAQHSKMTALFYPTRRSCSGVCRRKCRTSPPVRQCGANTTLPTAPRSSNITPAFPLRKREVLAFG
jgi:hypothetical protein